MSPWTFESSGSPLTVVVVVVRRRGVLTDRVLCPMPTHVTRPDMCVFTQLQLQLQFAVARRRCSVYSHWLHLVELGSCRGKRSQGLTEPTGLTLRNLVGPEVLTEPNSGRFLRSTEDAKSYIGQLIVLVQNTYFAIQFVSKMM